MSLTLHVEVDTHKADAWMLVLRDKRGELVGIPVRGETMEYVLATRKYIAYAVEYGMTYMQRELQSAARRVDTCVQQKQ